MNVRDSRPFLSEEDWRLWEEVRRTVTPLRSRRPAKPVVDAIDLAPKPASRPEPSERRSPKNPLPAHLPPPVTLLDDRTVNRLRKARIAIDARIDLHGLSEERAHAGLLHFLGEARLNGWRIVLVITGKGSHSGGVLRAAVPRWLGEARFAALVGGYRVADRSHGGEGALYVRLRRAGERRGPG